MRKHGFTIVELLIVIVVVGILAGISIVAYRGISDQARDNAVKSDIANAGKKISLFYIQNERFPITSTEMNAILGTVGVSSYATHTNALSYCFDSSTNSFAIGGVSASGKGFVYKDGGMSQNTGWGSGNLWTLCRDKFGIDVQIDDFGMWRRPSDQWTANRRAS